MAIYEGSRYTNVFAYDEEWKGKQVTAFYPRSLPKIDPIEEKTIRHTWMEGDRLDILAARYYGNPKYWWFILDANPRYFEESEIKNGDVLVIPDFDYLQPLITDNGEELDDE